MGKTEDVSDLADWVLENGYQGFPLEIVRWYYEYCKHFGDDYSLGDVFADELADDDLEWPVVSSRLDSLDKYYAVREVVRQHSATGKYFRYFEIDTCYGLYQYAEDADSIVEEYGIEEVFPVRSTAFKTKEEIEVSEE